MSSDALRAKVAELMPQAKADLSKVVAFRPVADPRQQPPEECRKAADGSSGRSPRSACRT